ncbi:peroxiredoxin [Methylosinus sporium]|uniref:peroxiredoxin n=1 Tax=Methylosinus sporium TaxID=428 RepID=UPI00383BD421
MEKEPIPASTTGVRALRVGDLAPVFQARSTGGEIRLDQFRGRWLIFFSHPADFTPVCTSEFVALARAAPRFEAVGCALLGLSVDSLYSHLAWVRAIRDLFGVTVPFPIVEDPTMTIGRAYGMLDETARDSSAMRATYYIDPQGVVRALTWYPLTVGRSVEEMLRLVTALKKAASGEVMTPEGWTPGGDLLLPPTNAAEDALAPGATDSWFYRTCKDSGK